jgi:hypothetical protein
MILYKVQGLVSQEFLGSNPIPRIGFTGIIPAFFKHYSWDRQDIPYCFPRPFRVYLL